MLVPKYAAAPCSSVQSTPSDSASARQAFSALSQRSDSPTYFVESGSLRPTLTL